MSLNTPVRDRVGRMERHGGSAQGLTTAAPAAKDLEDQYSLTTPVRERLVKVEKRASMVGGRADEDLQTAPKEAEEQLPLNTPVRERVVKVERRASMTGRDCAAAAEIVPKDLEDELQLNTPVRERVVKMQTLAGAQDEESQAKAAAAQLVAPAVEAEDGAASAAPDPVRPLKALGRLQRAGFVMTEGSESSASEACGKGVPANHAALPSPARSSS